MYQGYTKFLFFILSFFWGICAGFYPNVGFCEPPPASEAKAGSDVVQIEEGKQYERIPEMRIRNPRIQEFIAHDPGKIQVVEFFNYGCFWCKQLHSPINQWVNKKPEYVVFYRIPIVFYRGWDVLSKAFYTARALGLSEKLDEDFFKAIHDEHITISDEQTLEDFVKKHGVDPKTFMETYRSFSIHRQFNRDKDISSAYQIVLSPVFVVNTPSGSYLTSAQMAGSVDGVFKVIDHLIVQNTPKKN